MNVIYQHSLSQIFAALLCLVAAPLAAQQHLDVPREDGASTPLLVYAASPAPSSGCAPLALISHGAGGSEEGYRYLAQGMSKMGYTAVVMGHRESGLAALQQDMRKYGLLRGVTELVRSPIAENDRLKDVTAALDWSDKTCKPPFRVLLGHSMGAETVMLEAGAADMIGLVPFAAGRSRFNAFVAMSPEGPGIVFPEHAWTQIRKPVLVLTGTNDQSLKGGPEARLVPWREFPGNTQHCQWLGVIDGATHFNFGGNGPGHERVEQIVLSTIASYLGGVRGSGCTLPAPVPGFSLQAK
jgi:predicted dienelactone hydrolase